MELKDILFLYKEIKDLKQVQNLKQVQSENSKTPFDSQVKALQDQINVLELTKMEFNNFYRSNYKVDIPFLNEEIIDLKKAQSSDKASFDSQIATLRAQVDSFPAILVRLETLEKTITTLQQPPVKPKSWFASEQPTLLDSRPDTHPHAHLSALLHEMHDLNMDHRH